MKKTAILMTAIGVLSIGGFAYAGPEDDQTVLDKDVRVVAYEELNYPVLARTQGVRGIVVVRVRLDDQGRVIEAAAISGADAFVHDCLENAKQWRFEPSSHKTAVIVYSFRMPGGECKSASSIFMLKRPNFVTIIGCDVKR